MSLSQKNELLLSAMFALEQRMRAFVYKHQSDHSRQIKIPVSNNIKSTANAKEPVNNAKNKKDHGVFSQNSDFFNSCQFVSHNSTFFKILTTVRYIKRHMKKSIVQNVLKKIKKKKKS